MTMEDGYPPIANLNDYIEETQVLKDIQVRIEKIKSEYQRFYDFVADNDPALVDAWHFGENVKVQQEAKGD